MALLAPASRARRAKSSVTVPFLAADVSGARGTANIPKGSLLLSLLMLLVLSLDHAVLLDLPRADPIRLVVDQLGELTHASAVTS